jgi:hypothetical protein
MKTTILNFKLRRKLIVILSLVFLSFQSYAQEKISKDEAVDMIKSIKEKTGYNTKSFEKILKSTKDATCNYNSLVFIAELNRDYGYHSKLLEKLAAVITKSDSENEFFHNIAELIILDTSADLTILELAEDARIAKTDEEKERIKNKIKTIKKNVAYKSLYDVPKIDKK